MKGQGLGLKKLERRLALMQANFTAGARAWERHRPVAYHPIKQLTAIAWLLLLLLLSVMPIGKIEWFDHTDLVAL